MKLGTALGRALRAHPGDQTDIATVELAKHYAAVVDAAETLAALTPAQLTILKDNGLLKYATAIDSVEVLKKLGPHLLEALAELGMTPKARNAVMRGGVKPDGSSDKLDELRSRREHRAAGLVTAAS